MGHVVCLILISQRQGEYTIVLYKRYSEYNCKEKWLIQYTVRLPRIRTHVEGRVDHRREHQLKYEKEGSGGHCNTNWHADTSIA